MHWCHTKVHTKEYEEELLHLQFCLPGPKFPTYPKIKQRLRSPTQIDSTSSSVTWISRQSLGSYRHWRLKDRENNQAFQGSSHWPTWKAITNKTKQFIARAERLYAWTTRGRANKSFNKFQLTKLDLSKRKQGGKFQPQYPPWNLPKEQGGWVNDFLDRRDQRQ